jgi:hypothetical protein
LAILKTNLSQQHKDQVTKLMKNCEEVAKGYVPANELQGIGIARLLGEWSKQEGGTSQQIWGSLACAKNYYLNSHTDNNFFYSLTTTASSHGLQHDIDTYPMTAEVCNYFTFAEQEVAVALRPGDMLLFNPLYQHCLSSYTSFTKMMMSFVCHYISKQQLSGRMTIVYLSPEGR